MPVVVADTSPVSYLVVIDRIQILPQLFGRVLVPDAVLKELSHPEAPAGVRAWAKELPGWIEVAPGCSIDDPALRSLGAGEKAAIGLALAINADLILIDERKGTLAALGKGLQVTGTLGVLSLAARRGLIDLRDAFARLKVTNFRYRQEIMDALLNSD